MSPRAFIPPGAVSVAPGTSMVMKVYARATSGIPTRTTTATWMAFLTIPISSFLSLQTKGPCLERWRSRSLGCALGREGQHKRLCVATHVTAETHSDSAVRYLGDTVRPRVADR